MLPLHTEFILIRLDKDVVGRDHLGYIRIPLSDILSAKHALFEDAPIRSYALCSRNHNPVSGEIYLKVGFVELPNGYQKVYNIDQDLSLVKELCDSVEDITLDDVADGSESNLLDDNENSNSCSADTLGILKLESKSDV